MTRKHYNKLADEIYYAFIEGDQYSKHQIATKIASALRGTNPNYDFGRFYNACMNGRKSKKKK